MSTDTPRKALDRAAEIAGGPNKLAHLLRISPQAITGMRLRGRAPAERVLEIERATGVSRHDLRPDIYPIPDAADG